MRIGLLAVSRTPILGAIAKPEVADVALESFMGVRGRGGSARAHPRIGEASVERQQNTAIGPNGSGESMSRRYVVGLSVPSPVCATSNSSISSIVGSPARAPSRRHFSAAAAAAILAHSPLSNPFDADQAKAP